MSKRLIVNADGFGFGAGATQGIIDAIEEGQFISSISVTANFPEADRVVEAVTRFPHITIGVHLNPMVGAPVLAPRSVPSLVGPDQQFHQANFPRLLRQGKICFHELRAELNAQIRKVKELARHNLTHLDSHANQHLSYLDLFCSLARDWGLQRMRNNESLICLEAPSPIRSRWQTYLRNPHVWLVHKYRKYQMRQVRRRGMRMADRLITVGYAGTGDKTNPDNWLRVLHNLPPGTYEIYCHPAYPDATLRRWSSYCDERGRELEILRKNRLRVLSQDLGIQVINFAAL